MKGGRLPHNSNQILTNILLVSHLERLALGIGTNKNKQYMLGKTQRPSWNKSGIGTDTEAKWYTNGVLGIPFPNTGES